MAGMTHFVWLRNLRGSYDPQLWSEDYSVGRPGNGTTYRADCNRPITERIHEKHTLAPEDSNITLDGAIRKYPAPLVSRII
jgi:hypothetical protein